MLNGLCCFFPAGGKVPWRLPKGTRGIFSQRYPTSPRKGLV